jgi:nitronate monooxygenase
MRWATSRLTELLGVRYPIVQAPMAGGPSTLELAVAVSEAGGLGSIAAAMLGPDDLRAAIRTVRRQTGRPFAVNVFAPLASGHVDLDSLTALQASLDDHRRRLGLEPSPPAPPAPAWTVEDQLRVVAEERVPVLSFALGIPPLDAVGDVVLLGTATNRDEAVALERTGVHVVVAQGVEAGGHRSTFIGPFEDGLIGLAALVPELVDAVSLPVVAAGGIGDGRGIAAALNLGAQGVQLGTAFLFSTESGAGTAWRRALREQPTFISDAYTGRPARGARTPFLAELAAGPPPAPYEIQRGLTADFRGVDGCGWYLGGQAARWARELPAAELVAVLVRETETALQSHC